MFLIFTPVEALRSYRLDSYKTNKHVQVLQAYLVTCTNTQDFKAMLRQQIYEQHEID